ncbi:MAG: hypothetical protein WKF92_09805 [Pyrinomonadaceae bacterium]
MDISLGMINNYLNYITDGWIDTHGPPAADLHDYYETVMQIKGDVDARNDTVPFLLGLDYLLCNPSLNLDEHGTLYDWEDEEVREVIRYIRSTIYPNADPVDCEKMKEVNLLPMGEYEWWKLRIIEGLHPDFTKQ